MNKIEIPLSKTKLVLGICGSILFVVLGIYLLTTIADQQEKFNPALLKGIGIADILFFSATGIYGIIKMYDKKTGLTIDDNGISDNTNASSIGLIKWTDITEIRTEQVMSTKFLLIFINNPETYLKKASGMKQKLMETNMKIYGTPLSITSNSLKYHFKELENLINKKFNEQQKNVEQLT
jgi:hypothetical protein